MSQSEQALIGAAIIGNAFIDAQPLVDVSDFALESHRLIWKRCVDLAADGTPVDFMTVSDGLARDTQAYLTTICGQSYSVRNLKAYASAVKRDSLNRRIDDVPAQISSIKGDPEQRISEIQSLVLSLSSKSEYTDAVEATQIVSELYREIEERYEAEGELFGIPTGLPDLDANLCGMAPTDMTVMAGRPSHGKTAFLMQVLVNNQDIPALVFSLEMSRTQLMARMVSNIGRIDGKKLRQPKQIEESDWPRITAGMTGAKRSDLVICDRAGLHINQLCSMARQHKLRKPELGLIAVDYLQLLNGDGGNREQEISHVTRSLKGLAKELDVVVIALSQLNRSVDARPPGKRRPNMGDLRESGAIEQDADSIMFIYRDEVYDENSPAKGTAEIIIGKNRHGTTGTTRVAFLGKYTSFAPYTGRPIEDTPIKGRRRTGMEY